MAKQISDTLTFDDVLLLPSKSSVMPTEVNVDTLLTPGIRLSVPVISAAMDTVTESALAITMAQLGGIGIIHRNMTPEAQAMEVEKVKKSESGMILHPITLTADHLVSDVIKLTKEKGFSGVPIVKKGKLVGIVTHRDLRFERNLNQKVSNMMTKKVITAREGVTLEEAKRILHENRIEKLPVVDRNNNLKGLITIKDIEKAIRYPDSSKDRLGRLRVGAAIGVGESAIARAGMLIASDVDVIVIDTAHGHTDSVLETVKSFKRRFPGTPLIAGNVAMAEAAKDLIKAGADTIKVGVGPGSICTTRVVSGVGVAQLSAIMNCYEEAGKAGVPVIADGGIKFSGDITKAIAAGASSVMIGSLFAGTDEAPGEIILYQGRSYKIYRGMGSIGAMRQGSSDRYYQGGVKEAGKLVPEGIEGMVPRRGPLADNVHQLVGGLKSGMGYVGAENILELRKRARFARISSSGLKESHVHDVTITKEAPNYRLE